LIWDGGQAFGSILGQSIFNSGAIAIPAFGIVVRLWEPNGGQAGG